MDGRGVNADDLAGMTAEQLLAELDLLGRTIAADFPHAGERIGQTFTRMYGHIQRAALIQVELAKRTAGGTA